MLCVNQELSSNREDWLRWLLDTRRNTGDTNIDQDGQERCEQGRERVVHTTVLVNLNNLVNQPSHQVHPRERGGKGETRNNGVEGLRLEFTSNERNSFGSSRHFYI